MSHRERPSLTALAESVLADAEQAEQTKTAQRVAERKAVASPLSAVGTLLHKVAGELRAAPLDVTFDDLARFLRGEL